MLEAVGGGADPRAVGAGGFTAAHCALWADGAAAAAWPRGAGSDAESRRLDDGAVDDGSVFNARSAATVDEGDVAACACVALVCDIAVE